MDWLAQIGELPTLLLLGVLGLVMIFDAVPLLGVLVPGDVVILAAVGARGPSAGLAVLGAVVAGCLAGWSLSFLAGRRFADRLRRGRVGDWIGERRWAAAEHMLRRSGGQMVLVAPFLPVLNALLPLVAGGLRMSYRRFVSCAALGAAAWGGLYLVLGTAARSITGLLPGAPSPMVVTTVVGVLLATGVLAVTRRRLLPELPDDRHLAPAGSVHRAPTPEQGSASTGADVSVAPGGGIPITSSVE
ncbi:DedA family protein [Salinispora mooreana]|uniref:DedA family protein n=1 Tax=Salinispora mooreana TaxID=999545 RepID=UPI00035E76DA|nr:VTT domain-containing protein [Salinispora mooreana]